MKQAREHVYTCCRGHRWGCRCSIGMLGYCSMQSLSNSPRNRNKYLKRSKTSSEVENNWQFYIYVLSRSSFVSLSIYRHTNPIYAGPWDQWNFNVLQSNLGHHTLPGGVKREGEKNKQSYGSPFLSYIA